MLRMRHGITRVLYEVCNSYSGYSASSSCASHRDCWLHCLSLYLVELENVLIRTMALSFALAFLALLFWRKYHMVTMKKFISLSIPGNSADGFIMQASEILVHPYIGCLILLINTVSILWGLWNPVSSWFRRRQFLDEVILKCALGQLVLGWQGVWKDLAGSWGSYHLPNPGNSHLKRQITLADWHATNW